MKKERNLDILANFNILYIEDEVSLLHQTTTVLEDFVKEIYPCKDAKSAYEIIKSRAVDAIISDILLENTTGIEFLRTLREEGFETPIIFTTAYTDTKYLLEAIKLKAEGYMVKPINIKELLNHLYDLLLTKIQDKEIEKNENIIKTVAAITDTKAVEMVKFIINNLDENSVFNHSYSDIMDNIDVSKPTIIKLFKQLGDLEILVKLQNSKYQFKKENLANVDLL
ncbi:response regulator [Campylobacter geochelonis]|uniref:Two component transcriptional regulator n=1 Tax=Campylobacter geochelonis TaxID=1780362 RepID=A0A128EL46_9BACT|nr:response regulator [Campylobacter geochelonis]QKF72066.1 two-component system response regulator [Campylobacter geochelonis]CZE45833.1 two component transcriptional regulator [Campylobacter geochelonis]CZE46800.1 two component transcriptional regulator [Campylobacter geochelonis]CZE49846.1 two component transcriptional regulator [Campylobacter geochelonis]